MISAIARTEFHQALLTLRFAVGLILCVVAVAAGTLAMIEDYESRRQAYLQQVRDYETEVLEQEGPYARLVSDLKAFREPRQLAVFSVGSDRWQGNQVTFSHQEVPVYSRWLGLSNPLMALFRSVDVALIVQIILGLLALLFAHDTVCGEREGGTLRLMLANPVARDQVLVGKAAGHLGLLAVLLAVTYVVALLFVQASPALHLGAGEIGRVALMFAASGLYVAAMYAVGLLLSTWARRPATALVLAVFGWLLGVAVYPNVVGFAVDAYARTHLSVGSARSLQHQLSRSLNNWIDQREDEVGIGDWEAQLQRSSKPGTPWGYMLADFAQDTEEADVERKVRVLTSFIAEVERQRMTCADRAWREAWEPLATGMKGLHAVASGLSLLSPAGAHGLATAAAARTDRGDYWRFLESARSYRGQLIAFYEQQGWFGSREWFDVSAKATLEHLPRYRESPESIGESLARASAPLLVLAGFAAAGFLAAYWRFRRYDLTA